MSQHGQLLTTSMGGWVMLWDRDTMGTREKDISFVYSYPYLNSFYPLMLCPAIFPPVMQMHLTINKLEKACMFPWIKFFLFLRDNSFWSKLSAWRLTAACGALVLPSAPADADAVIMMANKRGNHVLCDHVSKYFMEINIFKENLECWDCDPGIMENIMDI